MKKLFAWIGRNERHLSTAAFVVSFLIDIVGYQRIDVPWVTILFTGMFLIATLCIIVSHHLHRDRPDAAPSIKNPFYTLLPIVAQFFTGGLLSGCFIFYTRSASIFSSWPFILLLAVMFFGNELFGKYRERLTFQTIQLFVALYLYAIFELPIERGVMGPMIFLESGLVSIVVFVAFLGILYIVGKKRLMQSLQRILTWCAGILIIINIFYFTGILPPLPLSLRDAGVYESVTKTADGYEVMGEAKSWNPFARQVVHLAAGSTLYAYSAVFAPVSLTTPIVHRWEMYQNGKWVTESAIAFAISGGRDSGYRGYSEFPNPAPGSWRVSIETTTGAVLGRVRFDVQDVATPPVLVTEEK